MQDLDDRIAQARRRVQNCRAIVERHRARILRGESYFDPLALMKTFELSQVIFEEALARLIEERDRMQATIRDGFTA